MVNDASVKTDRDALSLWKLAIANIIDTRIAFYESNPSFLPRRPTINLRHLRHIIKTFHSKCVLVPARCYCLTHTNVNVLRHELTTINAYIATPFNGTDVIHKHVSFLNSCNVIISDKQKRLAT